MMYWQHSKVRKERYHLLAFIFNNQFSKRLLGPGNGDPAGVAVFIGAKGAAADDFGAGRRRYLTAIP